MIDRRDFIKTATAAGVGLSFRPELAASADQEQGGTLFAAPPLETVRVGVVGLGNQGIPHVENLLNIEGVEITALCDLIPERVKRAQDLAVKAGKPAPAGHSRGPEEYRRLCERNDVDLVFNVTPWEMHRPVLLAAMRAGKHGATEVPMAVTVEECWELVEAAEKTKRHCVMMENCCYDRAEMMILNMVRQGLFGALLHAECGYLHDLRGLKLTAAGAREYYQGSWRIKHSIARNGDLYPTHGLGPVSQWMNINRGNRFEYLVSMATPSRGLNAWAAEHIGREAPEATRQYALGDVVNTLIHTAAGQTILVTHDTNLPRPYSRKILLQGTNGLVRKYPEQRIHIEGRSPAHRWEELAQYRAEFEHPLWKELEERSAGAGHGGMDYIEDYRLIRNLRRGEPLDMDVYDGAAWSSISGLSERSIARRSASVDVPDFTRGAWKSRPPLGVVTA